MFIVMILHTLVLVVEEFQKSKYQLNLNGFTLTI